MADLRSIDGGKAETPKAPLQKTLENASRGEILEDFFLFIESTIGTRMVSIKEINHVAQLVGEIRRRALEKRELSYLRDAHTMLSEVNQTLSTLKAQGRLETGGALVTPDGKLHV